MIRRRTLLLAYAALPAVSPVRAQGARRVVGFVGSSPPPNSLVIKPFVDGMRALGWAEGDNFILEYRGTLGDLSRAAELVRELQQRHVEVLVTLTTGIALEAHRAAPSLPIVMMSSGYPVEVKLGRAESYAKPVPVRRSARPRPDIGGLTSGPKPLRWGNRKLRKLLASLLDWEAQHADRINTAGNAFVGT